MDYEKLQIKGVPLLILRERGVLTRQFWVDHGATYPRQPVGGEKKCSVCGFIGSARIYFRDAKGNPMRSCSECRELKEERKRKAALLKEAVEEASN